MSTTEPTARYGHVAVGVGDRLFIWGGNNKRTPIQPTTFESFNLSALKWEHPRQLNGTLPDGLWNTVGTSDGEYGYTFGGYTGTTRLNTLYEINTRTLLCRELLPNSSSHAPKKVSGCRTVLYKKKLVVYGGYTGETCTDDLHVFDLDKSEYMQGNIKPYSCIAHGQVHQIIEYNYVQCLITLHSLTDSMSQALATYSSPIFIKS